MQYGMMDGYGYGMGWIWIIRLIFWILVLIGLVLLIKYLLGITAKGHETAIDILKKRYAKGEISKEEFEEKKKDII